ncbi:hypothetical protein DNTS_026476 [Danionella cerebrum]|uniref:Uncharacterized protein n=1 Tax=Danionella cerebrum TaxID=2873325 RepID=A0A553ML42_9TELE|nr:hypothetical protein DNTS_026476 [Danionella translucida]
MCVSQELLFSVCALNVISTIVCALATAVCCMQMVSTDLLQMVRCVEPRSRQRSLQMAFLSLLAACLHPTLPKGFMPHRSRALSADCMTPHGTILHQTLDFDEFIPPIPPPPYYPPEYTCTPVIEGQRVSLEFFIKVLWYNPTYIFILVFSVRGLHLDFPHSPFSAIYGMPINSPGALYPTDLPPPYESVVGQTPASQMTLSLEQQATESSVCERNTTAGLSTQGNCSSEELCSLEVQGSDPSLLMGPTGGSCTSLEVSSQCSLRRQTLAQRDVSGDPKPCSPQPSPDAVNTPEKEETANVKAASRPHHKERTRKKLSLLFPASSASQCSSSSTVTSAGTSSPSASAPPRGTRLCFSIWSPSSSSQPQSTSSPSSTSQRERPRTLRVSRGYRKLARIVRSTSEPISWTSTTRSDRSAPVSNHPPEESPLTPCDQGELFARVFQQLIFCTLTVYAEACMELSESIRQPSAKRTNHGGKKQKDGGKVEIQLKAHIPHSTSTERPHSLADLKTYKDTKVLVAKFLEHSSCGLPPEVQQVVNSIKSVIKSDEKHMEEAILSASIIDQLMTQSQKVMGSSRKHAHEELHLQSCGALSSPSSSMRHPPRETHQTDVPGPLGEPKPHSLISVCRETTL